MRRLLVLFAFLVGSGFTATAAAAQSDTAQRYATCLSQTDPDEVKALLQATSSDSAERPYHSLVDNDRCFARVFGNQQFKPEDVGASIDILRGRLAEQELLSQSPQIAGLQALPLQQKRYIRPWFAATGRNPAIDEMGACMADTDPSGIMALVRTTPRFSDENAAIAALSPALTKCLSAGTRLDASRQALRGALADALYQRLHNPAFSLVQTGGTAH
ncbi:MAG: hypothetical protein ACM3IG_03130 [Myxococcales bacterium]